MMAHHNTAPKVSSAFVCFDNDIVEQTNWPTFTGSGSSFTVTDATWRNAETFAPVSTQFKRVAMQNSGDATTDISSFYTGPCMLGSLYCFQCFCFVFVCLFVFCSIVVCFSFEIVSFAMLTFKRPIRIRQRSVFELAPHLAGFYYHHRHSATDC